MSRRPQPPQRKKLRIEIVWDASVPEERRAEYEESIRHAVRQAVGATPGSDGASVVRARVSARGSDLHWVLDPAT